MTPFLFNLMILAIVALKVLVMLLILNWIDRKPKKDVDTDPYTLRRGCKGLYPHA